MLLEAGVRAARSVSGRPGAEGADSVCEVEVGWFLAGVKRRDCRLLGLLAFEGERECKERERD